MNIRKLLKAHNIDIDNVKNIIDINTLPLEDSILILKKGKSSIKTIIEDSLKLNPLLIITNVKYDNPKVLRVRNIHKITRKLIKIIYKKNKKAKILAISGTSGKTSSAFISYDLLKDKNVALISSLGINYQNKHYQTFNTTPSYLTYLYLINYLNKEDELIIITEISSQGYQRIKKLKIAKIALSNISKEHLDAHKLYLFYILRKLKILMKGKEKIINVDDKILSFFSLFTKATKVSKNEVSYSLISPLKFNYKGYKIDSNLEGSFNLDNILLAVNLVKDYLPSKDIHINIKIPGRNNYYQIKDKNIVIDYAHAPFQVNKILEYYHNYLGKSLIVLIGLGGNRDKHKRKKMIDICYKYADKVIISEDNSRNEPFISIIKSAIKKDYSNLLIIKDRKEAIKYALSLVKEEYLLILGKGEEDSLIIKGKKIPHNDLKEVYKCLS